MSKELEALNELYTDSHSYIDTMFVMKKDITFGQMRKAYHIIDEDYKIINSALERKEKLEKAFELIKNKKVDVWYEIILSDRYDVYLDQKTDLSEELTEEEYDSLKEILG